MLCDNIQGITKPAVRRLARPGGVKHMSGLTYEENRDVLKVFLGNAEHAKRKTVTAMDVAIENTTLYEEDHNVEEETALTLLSEEDRGLEQWLRETTDTEVQAAEPEVVDEIETGQPTTTPPGWRNFTNTDPLPTKLIAKMQGRVDQKPKNDRLSDSKREVSGTDKNFWSRHDNNHVPSRKLKGGVKAPRPQQQQQKR
ncbi:unnamed protein product, partial [Ceratitis capitata]